MPYTPIIGVLAYVLHPDGRRSGGQDSDDRRPDDGHPDHHRPAGQPDGRRVLMVFRSRDGDLHRGKYNGLGGKLENDEDVVGCLHRELMEEAGITVTVQRLRGTISWPGFGAGGEDWFGFVFVVDAFAGDVPGRNEDGPLEWVPVERLLGEGEPLPMWPGDRHFLPLVFDDDPRPFHGVMPYTDGEPVSWSYQR